MMKTSALWALIFVVIIGIGLAFAYFEYTNAAYRESLSIAAGASVIAVVASYFIKIPDLEDAMSMQAQAERERQARVILRDSERQVAEKFGEAAKTYINDPVALHLRAMNMLYEGLKQNSTIVIVPSSAVETMQLGGLAGLTALTMGFGQDRAIRGKEGAQPGPWSEPSPAKAVAGQ